MNKYCKSYVILLFIIVMGFILTACGSKTTSSETSNVTSNQSTSHTNSTLQYTVRFYLNNVNATGKPANQLVEQGGLLTEPTEPQLDGYLFAGWYTDQDCTMLFIFTEPVNSDLNLYAKWVEDSGEDPTQIPDGLTYAEGLARVSAYITQMSDLIDAGVSAYDDKGNEWLGMGPLHINLGLIMPMIDVSFTATFGTENVTEEGLSVAFSLFGLKNISYQDLNNHYILEYDSLDTQENITYHYGIVVDYVPSLDSARVIHYKSYQTEEQEIENQFEFIKTSTGYAIQNSSVRAVVTIENKQVVSFTASTFAEDFEFTSIYKNSNSIDEDFAVNNMENTMIFDGNNYKFQGKDLEYDFRTGTYTRYRINTCEFKKDGTIISSTQGEWIPL